MLWSSLIVQSLVTLSFPFVARAYIPAVPANSTGSGLNVSDNSTITLSWSNGVYGSAISYQVAEPHSGGVVKGALVRMDETGATDNATTTTPWIALINCDKNATGASMETDIFTMISYKGAVAALLYSNSSDGCLVNKEYLSSSFDHTLDIFTTKSPASAMLIQSQYNDLFNQSYSVFDANLLNAAGAAVNASIPTDAHNTSPYLIAVLRSAHGTSENPSGSGAAPSPSPSHSSSIPSISASNGFGMIAFFVLISAASALHLA